MPTPQSTTKAKEVLGRLAEAGWRLEPPYSRPLGLPASVMGEGWPAEVIARAIDASVVQRSPSYVPPRNPRDVIAERIAHAHEARVEHGVRRRFWSVRLFDTLRGFPRQIRNAIQGGSY